MRAGRSRNGRSALRLLAAALAGAARIAALAEPLPAPAPESPFPAVTEEPRDLVGVVFAERALDLAAEIEGEMAGISVELGQSVARGQVLAKLDSPWLRRDLEAARARVVSAQAELDRAVLERDLAVDRRERRLLAPDVSSEEERSEARFAAEMAEAQISIARARLAAEQAQVDQLADSFARAVVRAPFDGVVSARYREPGERVTRGTPILRLVSDQNLRVRFGVPESLVRRTALGSELQAYFPLLDLTVPLKVLHLAPEIDLATGHATAEGTLLLPEARRSEVWPGMTVRVRLGPKTR